MGVDEIFEKVMSSGIFEQGIEQGESNKEEEVVRDLFDFGMSRENISEALKLDLDRVNDILS